MNSQTVLLDVASVSALVIIIGLILIMIMISASKFVRRKTPNRHSTPVAATITDIQVKASSVSNWWVVTAQWTNPQTNQTHVFRSRLRLAPKQRQGESIIVDIDPTHPQRYRMNF